MVHIKWKRAFFKVLAIHTVYLPKYIGLNVCLMNLSLAFRISASLTPRRGLSFLHCMPLISKMVQPKVSDFRWSRNRPYTAVLLSHQDTICGTGIRLCFKGMQHGQNKIDQLQICPHKKTQSELNFKNRLSKKMA